MFILDANIDQSYSLFNHYSSSSLFEIKMLIALKWQTEPRKIHGLNALSVAQNKLKLLVGYAFRYRPIRFVWLSQFMKLSQFYRARLRWARHSCYNFSLVCMCMRCASVRICLGHNLYIYAWISKELAQMFNWGVKVPFETFVQVGWRPKSHLKVKW